MESNHIYPSLTPFFPSLPMIATLEPVLPHSALNMNNMFFFATFCTNLCLFDSRSKHSRKTRIGSSMSNSCLVVLFSLLQFHDDIFLQLVWIFVMKIRALPSKIIIHQSICHEKVIFLQRLFSIKGSLPPKDCLHYLFCFPATAYIWPLLS